MRRRNILNILAKQGKIFTFEDAQHLLDFSPESLKLLLFRLENDGVIERIEKGKYIIIPVGSEKGKYTLHEFTIASVLVKPYCISYWSALHHYGLTEQIPSTVFIQTTRRKKKREITIFGVNYKFIQIKKEKLFGTRNEWIDDAKIPITDKEKTIIDCLDKPQYCGGIVEVIKALQNKNINYKILSQYAQKIGNSGVIRRLGFLCDYFHIDIDLPEINTRNYLCLDPTMPKKGEKNTKWHLIINLDKKIMGVLE